MRSPRRFLLVATTVAVVFVVGVLPLALVVRRALQDGQAFVDVLQQPSMREAFLNTLVLALSTAAMAVALGTPLAWLTTRTDLPFRRTLSSLLALPYVIPPYIAAVAWINLANPRVGWLNTLLGEGTLDIYGLGGLTWVMGLSLYPYVFLTARATLESADPSLEEAARMSGAGTWRVLRDVTFPILRPAMLSSGTLVFLAAAAAFGAPALIGGPARLDFLSTRIYESLTTGFGGMGEASAMACLLFALVLLPLLLRLTRHAVVTGKAARPSVLPLGRTKALGLAFAVGVVALAVVLPFVAIGGTALLRVAGRYTWDNLTLANFQLLATGGTAEAILTSVGLAASAALVATLLGGVVAWIVAKTRLRGRALLAAAAALPLATPGTVLALGLILLWTRPLGLAGSLTNTVWILGIAYLAKYTPLATRAIQEGFALVDDALPEAAKMSGAHGLFLVRTIWIPLLLPSLLAGFILVFMPAFSELTMSVLLVGPGLDTVGTRMFELQEYAGPTAASVLATLVLVLIVGASLLLRLLSRGRYGL